MTTLPAGLEKLCTPILDNLHLRGAANTAYQYLQDKPFMLWIIIAFTVCLVAAIILIVVLSIKAHNRTVAIRDIEEHPQLEHVSTQDQPQAQTEDTTPITADVEKPETEEVTKLVTEDEDKSEPINPTPPTPSLSVSESNDQETEKPSRPVEVADNKKANKYRGKWVLYKLITQQESDNSQEEMYFFELRASNGEKLLESQEYTSLSGAKKGIETHLNNIKNNHFKVSLTKKGTYIFKLMNAKGMLLCTGENYTSRIKCENAIDSTKRFAESAVIEEIVQEIVIKIPTDDNSNVIPPSEGAIGKWVLSKQTDDLGEESYYFELFANNGEKLLSSEDYTSEDGARNGLETHRKNIEQGRFRIVPTKRGDYIFKLLNANNQLLCLGEHYKTRRSCQNAVESVKRFALTSPIVRDEE